MSITYQALSSEVNELQSKLLNIQVIGELDEMDNDSLDYMQADIKEVKDETQRILYFTTMMQIKPELKNDDDDIMIPPETPLSAETLFAMASDLETFKKQNLLLALVNDILSDEDDEAFMKILTAYDVGGMEKLIDVIKKENLISHIGNDSGLKYILARVITGTDLYIAMEQTLLEYDIDAKDPKIIENASYPKEILDYVEAFNVLILSKMGVNYATIHSGGNMLN